MAGEIWLCGEEISADAEADADRLAAAAQEAHGWSDEEADRAETERLQQVMAEDLVAHPELAAQDEAVATSGDLPADRGSLLIRTDFTHQPQWQALLGALKTPDKNDFLPYVTTIEQSRWAGASVAEVVDAAPPHVLLVIADAEALSSPEMPLLMIQVGSKGARQLRVTPPALASVENNLFIANMDWEDFASSTDPDGVFRGFN